MITIDAALQQYIDTLNTDESVGMECYRERLSAEDYEEFQVLTPFINMVEIMAQRERFKKAFTRVCEYRDSLLPDKGEK
jgi:hypothetical protein